MLYEIHIDNDGDGRADITYQFQFTDGGREPEHVPLQHRADRVARQPELEPPAVLLGDPRRRTAGSTVLGHEPGLPAVQHRAALDAELRRARRRRRSTPCRAARRSSPASGGGLLRRPRRDLRPRRPAAVRSSLHAIFGLPAAPGVNSTNGVNVHSIALQVPIERPDPRRHGADRPDEPRLGDRRVGDGEPPKRGSAAGSGDDSSRPLGAGLAPGQPAVQRGDRADGQEGPVERPAAADDTQFLEYVAAPRARGAARRSSTRACSRTWPRSTRAAGGPRRDPADRDPGGRRSRASRTTPGRPTPTCSG